MEIELPQLKSLDEALHTLRLVDSGFATGEAVAYEMVREGRYQTLDPRQGLYRLQATALLGLIQLLKGTRPHQYQPTALGEAYFAASPAKQKAMRMQILIDYPPTLVALQIVSGPSRGVTEEEAVEAFTPLLTTLHSPVTRTRRVTDFLRWLIADGLVGKHGGRYRLTTAGRSVAKLLGSPDVEQPSPGKAEGLAEGKKRRVQDAALRAKIENAAVDAATKWYLDAGRSVKSREKENKGWDLDVTGADLPPLKVEVKGTSQPAARVDLSPNEYDASIRYVSAYRVAIVTSALHEGRVVREYHYDFNTRSWTDPWGHVVRHEEIIGLRLSE